MKPALIEQHTATDKRTAKLDPGSIETRGLQTRDGTDAATVATYAEIYRAGGSLPPIVVFEEQTGTGKSATSTYWLGDGHHRLAAAKRAELDEIDAIVKRGDRRAALWYASAANAQHGLPRTNEDKRRAVALILADEEWRQLSDAQLAEHVQVSDRLVAKVRKEIGAESNTRKGKDGKTRAKPTPKAKPSEPNRARTAIQRELCGDGENLDEVVNADLPPGIYLDNADVLISSDGQAARVLLPGKKIRTSYGTGGLIETVKPYRVAGCQVFGVTLKDGGIINELVTWNGEIRKLFARNEDRCIVGTGPRPKKGKDDSADLAKIARPLRSAKPPAPTSTSDLGSDLDRCIRQAAAMFAKPPAGPTTDDVEKAADYLGINLGVHWFKIGIDGIQQDRDGGWHTLREDPAADDSAEPEATPSGPEEVTTPPPPAAAPAAPPPAAPAAARPLALRRVDKQRDLIAVELGQGKARWTGTDNDLFLLGLICGVPTRAQAWIDNSRAQARDLFIDALRGEVAERVRSGEAANTPKWPSIRELCALWGLDFTSIEIRAERAVPV